MTNEEITPIMAEYVADVFSRKEQLDNISYGYCMEIADVFRRYAKRAEQEQPEKPTQDGFSKEFDEYFLPKNSEQKGRWVFADIFSLARHFYELGMNSVPLPEDTVLFNKGVEEGKKLMMEDCPKWHKVQRGSCFDKHTNFLLSAREGYFYCSAMEVPRDGYILLVDELERLPKEVEE